MIPTFVLFASPWLLLLAFLVLFVRLPSELPASPSPAAGAAGPLVSIVVPARNEAVNIEACVRSLVASKHPAFEVVVVDDRSEDETGALARTVESGNARRLVVLDGQPLPEGWLGKPWACRQGADAAEGELLLFTDADTLHEPELLGRAVAGLEEERADLLTVMGRQLMVTFWERLVQPQVFLTMLFRFPRFERTARNGRWRDAIANGQYMLFLRESYERLGGHGAVRDEVVEDLALAQHVKRAGMRLRIRSAETDLATRMYRSLGELVAGWSKNIVMGGLQSVPRWTRPFVPPLALSTGLGLWIVPPAVLGVALLWSDGGAGLSGSAVDAVTAWALLVCGVSVVTWGAFGRRIGAPVWTGLLYPLGASVGIYIFVRSWRRGRKVEWKGRRYTLPDISERP